MSIRVLEIVLLCGLLSACIGGKLPPPEYRWILKANTAQIVEKMKGKPVEERYVIYLHSVNAIRPTPLGLADGIASMGGKAVPYLINKLEVSNDSVEKLGIFNIFHDMALQGCYDVNADKWLSQKLKDQKKILIDKKPSYKDYLSISDFDYYPHASNSICEVNS